MADITITAANVAAQTGATSVEGTAGGTITQGMAVYKDASDSNRIKAADADAEASAAAVGIALNAASSGQPIKYLTGGDINLGATLTVGQVYVPSTTAGGIAPYSDLASGDFVTILGIAKTSALLSAKLHVSGIAKP